MLTDAFVLNASRTAGAQPPADSGGRRAGDGARAVRRGLLPVLPSRKRAALPKATAIGLDMDPLAVLMATVWTRPVRDAAIEKLSAQVIEASRELSLSDVALPWIDGDSETREFVQYWFATRQRNAIRRLAHVLHHLDDGRASSSARAAADVLRLALSRIIITKRHEYPRLAELRLSTPA